MTQKKFAHAIGMSQGHYSKIESGTQESSKTLILAIMARFSVNPCWLQTGKGEMLAPGKLLNALALSSTNGFKVSENAGAPLADPGLEKAESYGTPEQNQEWDQFLRLVWGVWRRGDERTRKTLVQLVKALETDHGKPVLFEDESKNH